MKKKIMYSNSVNYTVVKMKCLKKLNLKFLPNRKKKEFLYRKFG